MADQEKFSDRSSEARTEQVAISTTADVLEDQSSTYLSLRSQDQTNHGSDLSIPVLLSILDAYFQHCHNQPYSFFHEGNFRQRLSDGTLPQHLLLAVLASAVRFSAEPVFEGKTFEAAVAYANRSWKSVVSTCFAASRVTDLQTVQTITLLSIFDFTGEFEICLYKGYSMLINVPS